jgi:hypothetical protein
MASSFDVLPPALSEMDKAQRDEYLTGRKAIFKMLINKAILFQNQHVKLLCSIDGSEAMVLRIPGYWSQLLKLEFQLEFQREVCITDFVDTSSRKHWWIKPSTE